jgi:hypothetical protein
MRVVPGLIDADHNSGERKSLDCDKMFEYRGMFDRCQVLEMKEECDVRRKESESMVAASAGALHMTSALRPVLRPNLRAPLRWTTAAFCTYGESSQLEVVSFVFEQESYLIVTQTTPIQKPVR